MIRARVRGQQAILRRLQRSRENFATIVEDVDAGAWLTRRIQERFKQGRAPDGSPWPALDPKTVRRKKYSGGAGPLQRTGRLLHAIRQITGRADGIFAINTGLGFRIGVADEEASEYGRVHNYGLFSGGVRKKLPKRRFMGLSDNDARSIREMLRRRARQIIEE